MCGFRPGPVVDLLVAGVEIDALLESGVLGPTGFLSDHHYAQGPPVRRRPKRRPTWLIVPSRRASSGRRDAKRSASCGQMKSPSASRFSAT